MKCRLLLLSGLILISTSGYAMKLSSPAFSDNSFIPVKYSCKGKDVSPPLQWEDIPAKTQSFVLILSDPDAPLGTWDHWIVVNIPSTQISLAENSTSVNMLPNSWGRKDYGGPCPPSGLHHYVFDLYALDTKLDLSSNPNLNKQSLLSKIKPHIIDIAQLTGLFQK